MLARVKQASIEKKGLLTGAEFDAIVKAVLTADAAGAD